LVEQLAGWYEFSGRRACGLMLLSRGTYHYRSHAQDRSALKIRLQDLALSRVRFGCRRLLALLKREGWPVGKKLVYRLYAELGLQVRTKRRKKLASAKRVPQVAATGSNQRWSMDFVTDRLDFTPWLRPPVNEAIRNPSRWTMAVSLPVGR